MNETIEVEVEMSPRRRGSGRLITGVLLIAFGLLMLVDNFLVFDIGEVWQLWPLILVALGVSKLTRGWTGGGAFLVVLGGWFLLGELGIWEVEDTWPVLLMALGGIMIVSSVLRPRRVCGPL